VSNDWLRLWHDLPNDPKWRTIARVSGKSIPAVISVYIHMLVCASNATERGRTQGWCDEDVANALDLSTDDVNAIREAMQGRVLDGDYLKGWEKRQPKREDGAAERAKAWRDRKKQDHERPRTQTNAEKRPDTDTDTDTDTDPSVDDGTRVNVIFEWLQKFLNSPIPLFTSPIAAWLTWGADFELDIKPVAERWRKKNPKKAIRSLEWLDDDIAASIQKRAKVMPKNSNDSGGSNANPKQRPGDAAGKPTFTSEAARIAAGFLAQPAGEGKIDGGAGPGVRIAEAVREDGGKLRDAG
jgi:hypothetical protein